VLNELARGDTELARAHRHHASPDCYMAILDTIFSAPWVNRRGFVTHKGEARDSCFRKEKIPSTFNWDLSPIKASHIELGIAESNLFPPDVGARSVLFDHTACGCLSDRDLCTIRSISRALRSALNYACYQGRTLHGGGERHHRASRWRP